MPSDSVVRKLQYEKLDQTFSACYKEQPGTANEYAHIHKEYELLLCLSDDTFCQLADTRHELSKNTLLIFNNMDLHFFGTNRSEGENKRYVIYFNQAYIHYLSSNYINLLDCFLFRPFENSQILNLSDSETAEITATIKKIIYYQGISDDQCYGRELHMQLLLAELLLDANTCYRRQHNLTCDSDTDEYHTIYSIINYIHTHYVEELSLDDIAKKFFINKYALCERFRRVAGITPNKYIVNCRIMKSKELLNQGLNVDTVCADAGFNNLSHFSRTFKKMVGLSPKQYQQQNRKK